MTFSIISPLMERQNMFIILPPSVPRTWIWLVYSSLEPKRWAWPGPERSMDIPWLMCWWLWGCPQRVAASFQIWTGGLCTPSQQFLPTCSDNSGCCYHLFYFFPDWLRGLNAPLAWFIQGGDLWFEIFVAVAQSVQVINILLGAIKAAAL